MTGSIKQIKTFKGDRHQSADLNVFMLICRILQLRQAEIYPCAFWHKGV